jgi:hypothetical protein
VCWFLYIIYSFLQFDRSVGQTKQTLFTMGLVLLVYVPKMVLTLVLLGEDIFRMGAGSISYFVDYNDNTSFLVAEKICKSGRTWVSGDSIYVFDLRNNHR